MKFVDTARFSVKSGKGGDGAVSFRHELYVPNGGPNGGDGGDGGDIVFIADEGKSSLLDLKVRRAYEAQDGFKGDIKNMHGKDGEDTVIRVPVGTVLFDSKLDEMIVDFKENGQKEIIAKGGQGGRGNARFANSRNKAPTIFEAGDYGITIDIRAELKVLADVGFVGLPNAGKSTLLRAISNSKPEVADYPFTTLTPQLGVCRDNEGRTFVAADLPGLIAGASVGKGLGHEFLRHIERCRVICHVIDMSGSYGTENVVENYKLIRKELVDYNLNLDTRPEIIVANKIDLEEAQINLLYFQEEFKDKIIIPISGLKKSNIDQLLTRICDSLAVAPTISLWDLNGFQKPDEDFKLYTFTPDSPDIKITNKGNGHWKLDGDAILKIYQKTPISTNDNLLLFNEKLKTIGAYDALRKRGVKAGDIVEIYEIEMEWMD